MKLEELYQSKCTSAEKLAEAVGDGWVFGMDVENPIVVGRTVEHQSLLGPEMIDTCRTDMSRQASVSVEVKHGETGALTVRTLLAHGLLCTLEHTVKKLVGQQFVGTGLLEEQV